MLCPHFLNRLSRNYYRTLLLKKFQIIVKKQCLSINGTQAVKYETGKIRFKNFDKQIPIPFKISADTECLLKKK